jgi:hypothetical protein
MGAQPAEVAAKHQAAQRWVNVVNRWGQLGQWQFMACHDPQGLPAQLLAACTALAPLPTAASGTVPVHASGALFLTKS